MVALMAKATIYSIFTRMHNSALSEQLLVQALEISRELGDRSMQAKLNWNLMLNYLFSKRPNLSLDHGMRALELARTGSDQEQLAFILNDLCRLYTCRGEFEKAAVAVQEARSLWQSMDNQVMLADSLGAEAEARFNAGEFDLAYQCTQEALQITERIENGWGQSYDRMLLSFVDLERGEMGRGIQLANKSLQLADEAGLIASSIGLRAELAWVYAYCGAFERGLPLIDQALEVAAQKQPAWAAFPQAAKIRMYLLQEDAQAAQKFAGGALFEPISIPYARYTIFLSLANIELAVSRGDYERGLHLAEDLLQEVMPLTRPDVPEVFRWKGEALLGLNRNQEAHTALAEACARAERLGAQPQLWPILTSLARADSRLGEEKDAQMHLERARQIIKEIAASLEPAGLSEAFLRRHQVRAVLAQSGR
jgi:tetratricopeptide (TPR) repeat protein